MNQEIILRKPRGHQFRMFGTTIKQAEALQKAGEHLAYKINFGGEKFFTKEDLKNLADLKSITPYKLPLATMMHYKSLDKAIQTLKYWRNRKGDRFSGQVIFQIQDLRQALKRRLIREGKWRGM